MLVLFRVCRITSVFKTPIQQHQFWLDLCVVRHQYHKRMVPLWSMSSKHESGGIMRVIKIKQACVYCAMLCTPCPEVCHVPDLVHPLQLGSSQVWSQKWPRTLKVTAPCLGTGAESEAGPAESPGDCWACCGQCSEEHQLPVSLCWPLLLLHHSAPQALLLGP